MFLRTVKTVATIGDSGEPRFLAIVSIIAFFAGAARAVLGRNEKTRWYDVVAAAIVSAIAGCSVGALALYYWGPEKYYLIIPCSSVSGWMGVALMDYVGGIALVTVKRKFDGSGSDPRSGT
jgi:uncharacterized membrane protein YoaK (UPF0700 family)